MKSKDDNLDVDHFKREKNQKVPQLGRQSHLLKLVLSA